MIEEKNILSKKINSFDEIFSNYEYFIFDCDGIIWKESEIITECVKTIKNLQNIGKKIFFLSNVNRTSRYDVQKKLKTLCDLDIDIKNIYSASYLISRYIATEHTNVKNVYLIGEEGLERELEEQGLKIYGGPKNKNIETENDYHKIISMEVDKNIDACVCGYDSRFDFFKIIYATYVIFNTGMYFGTNYDHQTKVGNKLVPGAYTFISAIETSTGKKATIVTKPDPRNLELIMLDHNIKDSEKNKILMIGDNLKTDIKFANNCSIDSIVLLTGVTDENELKNIENGNSISIPTYILKHF
jgi:phosphoglycolate/pyridoxal phosphate phosphatase family enzyme